MKSIADIKAIREKMRSQIIMRDNSDADEIRVVIGMATCGISAGARPVYNTFIDEVAKRNLTNVKVSRTGCLGMCKLEPIVEVYVPNKEKVTYCHVDSEKAMQIVVNHLVNGNVCTDYLVNSEE
ncbi:MAG: (2Fe-2S) ferredoxin domain-containing protein [Clostridia bacterium]|nr:(2Fe-2S) ferredoxin domain-containing protein [Clostridia bacterium]